MDKKQFEKYCECIGLNPEDLNEDLDSLNKITEHQLRYVHYSTLPLQMYPKIETELKWSTIFRRLVLERRGGLCYERDEVLYQALSYLGFDVHRIECRAVKSKNELSSRHDHMAVAVKLNASWYLCDAGWGHVMFNNALELVSGKAHECKVGIWRPTGLYEYEKSSLDPSLPKYWEIEVLHLETIYPDFDNYEKKASNSWTPRFRLTFESVPLSDFEKQCHNLHVNKDEFCNANSFFGQCGISKDGIPFHLFVKGTESMKTEFLTNTKVRLTTKTYQPDALHDLALKMNINPDFPTWDIRNEAGTMIHDPR